MQKRLDALGLWGALPLGMLFALTFCPVSAALFFGSLIPLSVKARSSGAAGHLRGGHSARPPSSSRCWWPRLLYSVAKAFNALTKVERCARRITGALFLGIGVYYSLKFVFGVLWNLSRGRPLVGMKPHHEALTIMKAVLYVCVHNAGRSQMAEAFTNRLAAERGLAVRGLSAGTGGGCG